MNNDPLSKDPVFNRESGTMKIAVIGRGNVATHLMKALSPVAETVQVSPRTLEELPADADIYMISVSDDAIGEVEGKLPELNGIVAHTSGSVPMDILRSENRRIGVVYPMQTFSKTKPLQYDRIPFFIEGDSEETTELLEKIPALIGARSVRAGSELRKRIHISSVFACNFANHLWAIADDILREAGLDFEILRPLLEETIDKTSYLSPAEGQTGPAVRGDRKVMDSHIAALESEGREREAEIYRILSDNINRYRENRHERNKL